MPQIENWSEQGFDLVREAYEAAQGAPNMPRADSQGAPLSVEAALWWRYGEYVRGDGSNAVRADAARRLIGRGAQARVIARADSTTFFQGDLVERDQRISYRPQRPNALVAALPVEPVTPWMQHWTAKYGEFGGVAQPWTIGQTEISTIDAETREEQRPMMMLAIAVPELFGEEQTRAVSMSGGIDQGRKADAAMYAHLSAHNSAILDGIAGFGGYSLRNHPGMHRVAGAVVYGLTVIDTVLAELDAVLSLVGEEGSGAIRTPNTMLCTRRWMNRLRGYYNLATSGGNTSRAVDDLLTEKGITEVRFTDELKDYGGTKIDAVVLFNRDSGGEMGDGGLKQVVGLRPAPVTTYQLGLNRNTAWMSSLGGVYARVPGEVVIYTAEVS